MIVKTLDHADVYASLSPLLAPAFDYLRRTDLAKAADGKYELRGSDLFALVQSYQTAPAATKKWEAHRDYVDIQYVVSGAELMGYAPRSLLRETEAHDPARDVAFYADSEVKSFVRLQAGMFCILGPEDVHLPGVSIVGPTPIKKVVLKVAAVSFQSCGAGGRS